MEVSLEYTDIVLNPYQRKKKKGKRHQEKSVITPDGEGDFLQVADSMEGVFAHFINTGENLVVFLLLPSSLSC